MRYTTPDLNDLTGNRRLSGDLAFRALTVAWVVLTLAAVVVPQLLRG